MSETGVMGLTITLTVVAFTADVLGEGVGIAVLPIIVQSATGVASFAIGGTSLLIIVSVVIDLIRRLDAQVSMHEY